MPTPEAETKTETEPATATETEIAHHPSALATSQEIRDRGSTFVGHVYRARTTDEAKGAHHHHHRHHRQHQYHAGNKQNRAPPDSDSQPYAIAAWRCMGVRPGRTGLGGPEDFEVEEGCEDGGERWAGKRVLGVMQREGVMDVVVIVSRW